MKKNLFVDIENTRSEEMRQKWQKILDSGENPFDLKNIKKWIGGEIIDTRDHWFVFQNDHPYEGAKHQFVIVSKKFHKNITEFSAEEWVDLHSMLHRLITKYKITGGGFSMRFGDTKLSGGSVVHIHAQLTVPEDGKKVAVWFGSEQK